MSGTGRAQWCPEADTRQSSDPRPPTPALGLASLRALSGPRGQRSAGRSWELRHWLGLPPPRSGMRIRKGGERKRFLTGPLRPAPPSEGPGPPGQILGREGAERAPERSYQFYKSTLFQPHDLEQTGHPSMSWTGHCSGPDSGAFPNPRVALQEPAQAPPGHTKRRSAPPATTQALKMLPGVPRGLLLPSHSPGAWLLPPAEARLHTLFKVETLGWSWCERPSALLERGLGPTLPSWGADPTAADRMGAHLASRQVDRSQPCRAPRRAPARPSPGAGHSPAGAAQETGFYAVSWTTQLPQSCFALKSGKGQRMGLGAIWLCALLRVSACGRASANSSPSSVLLLLFQIIIVWWLRSAHICSDGLNDQH